jgi:uncharacterized protein (TIGR03067 family)
MWRSLIVVPAVCIVALAETPKSDLKKLQGTWLMVSSESQGKKSSDERVKSTRLVIKGDKYTLHRGDDSLEGTLKLDPKQKPKTIDSTTSDGDTLLGIYEL